jgi:hypothetical protein
MQRLKDAANPSSRPYSLTPVLIKRMTRCGNFGLLVMPGLDPGIHVLLAAGKAWMAASSPAMTMRGCRMSP